ncbi:MAG: hypothetical protein ACOX18_03780 [Bacillota bacterium]|jgi:hypothetical protein
MNRAAEWLDALQAGELEALVDILDFYGPQMLGALAGRPPEVQARLIEKALRCVARQAGRYRDGAPEDFIWASLAKGIGMPTNALRQAPGAELDRLQRMQIVRRLAQNESKNEQRRYRFGLVTAAIGIIALVLAASAVTSVFSLRSHLLLVESLSGRFGNVVGNAWERDLWVVCAVDDPQQLTYLAQPTLQVEARLSLPPGEILAVLPDGDVLLDNGSELQRLGLEGSKWSLRKPAKTVHVLSNGLILFYENPLAEEGADPQQMGKVSAHDLAGRLRGTQEVPPGWYEFAPAGESWVALRSVDVQGGDRVVECLTAQGEKLQLPCFEAEFGQLEGHVVTALAGRVSAWDSAENQLWSVGLKQERPYYRTYIAPLGRDQGWLVAFEGTTSTRRSGTMDSLLASISPEGEVRWQTEYRAPWFGYEALKLEPALEPETGAIAAIVAGENRTNNRLQLVDLETGRVLGRATLTGADGLCGYSLIVAADGVPHVLVVTPGRIMVYQVRQQ